MKKPHPVAHMIGYGITLGFVLAMIYWWATFVNNTIKPNDILFNLGASAFMSCFFGAMPGLILGFVDGYAIWFLNFSMRFPMDSKAFQNWHKFVLFIVGGLTVVGMSVLTVPIALVFSIREPEWVFWWLNLPILIATIAALYAANRYMLELRVWANVGKAKNDYKLKNQLADTTSIHDSATISEAESQVKQLRQ